MLIRAATSGDLEAIRGLLNALLATTAIEWTESPHTDDDVRRWFDEHERVLVAEEHDEVVGVAAYGWFRDAVRRPGYRCTVENTIHVRRDHWRSGVGRALMTALIAEAQATGKHVMVAAIDGANDTSIRFHRTLGFEEVARLPEVGAKFGRWHDLVLLQLRLDDRPTPGPAGTR